MREPVGLSARWSVAHSGSYSAGSSRNYRSRRRSREGKSDDRGQFVGHRGEEARPAPAAARRRGRGVTVGVACRANRPG